VVENNKGHTVLSLVRIEMDCGERSGGVCRRAAFGAPVLFGKNKTTKYQIDSLNGCFIAFGITFVFMVNGTSTRINGKGEGIELP
jgi:hypothetical protein